MAAARARPPAPARRRRARGPEGGAARGAGTGSAAPAQPESGARRATARAMSDVRCTTSTMTYFPSRNRDKQAGAMKPAFRPARAALALLAVLGLALPLSSGCSHGLEPEQCEKFRSDSFDIINKAQHCNDDKDCRQSEWPGCAKPLSNESFEKIKAMRGSSRRANAKSPSPTARSRRSSTASRGSACTARRARPRTWSSRGRDHHQVARFAARPGMA